MCSPEMPGSLWKVLTDKLLIVSVHTVPCAGIEGVAVSQISTEQNLCVACGGREPNNSDSEHREALYSEDRSK